MKMLSSDLLKALIRRHEEDQLIEEAKRKFAIKSTIDITQPSEFSNDLIEQMVDRSKLQKKKQYQKSAPKKISESKEIHNKWIDK